MYYWTDGLLKQSILFVVVLNFIETVTSILLFVENGTNCYVKFQLNSWTSLCLTYQSFLPFNFQKQSKTHVIMRKLLFNILPKLIELLQEGLKKSDPWIIYLNPKTTGLAIYFDHKLPQKSLN